MRVLPLTTKNRSICCGVPSSRTTKSCGVRSATTRPLLSWTTTSTSTTSEVVRNGGAWAACCCAATDADSIATKIATVKRANFFPLAAGPHPRRDLSLTPRRGFAVRGSVWPQALPDLCDHEVVFLSVLPFQPRDAGTVVRPCRQKRRLRAGQRLLASGRVDQHQ